jgi:tetratricopeptide (TPR) repeat protein
LVYLEKNFFGDILVKRKPSWKTVLEQRRKENFVGRQEQLRVFSDNFAGDVPNYMVFSITGEGGVGKSTLLEQYESMALSPAVKAIVISCDDRYVLPASAMGIIAQELGQRNISSKDFDERYKRYQEIREEIERDPKAPPGAIDLLARGVSDIVIKSGRNIPGVGVFLERVDEKATGEALAQLINYGITRWGNKDEVLLLRDTERVLTPLFLELLAKVSEQQRLVLMFDVFERTGPSLSPWLLALLNFEYGEFDTNLTFVISGRDPLEQHWTELAGGICRIALDPFTLDETQRYLHNQAIYDDRLVTQIHEDTGGLPVLVELLAATKPQPGVPLPDVSKDAVERFLQWIPQEERRRVALLAATPRQFNRDTLSVTLSSDAASTFSWLSTQSFVRTNAERGCFYHEKVRELMLRHLRHTTPKDLEEAHSRLAGFFAHEQSQLNLAGATAYDSETWRKLEHERIYHSLAAQPDQKRHEALNAFFHAFHWRWSFAKDIAQTLQPLGHEQGLDAIRESAHKLLAIYDAYDQDKPLLGIKELVSLENQDHLTSIACCEIYALRGAMSLNVGKWEQALTNLNHAIELDEQYAWAIIYRGNLHCIRGQYEKALADFTHAIILDEQNPRPIAWRGLTYLRIGQYAEALADLTHAITLEEHYTLAIVWRGETHRRIAKYEEANTDFTRVVESGYADAFCFSRRGATYQAIDNKAAAQVDLARVMRLPLEKAHDYYGRGVALVLSNKYDEAIETLGQAFKCDVANWIEAETDDLLDPIRNLSEFQSLLDSTVPSWRR